MLGASPLRAWREVDLPIVWRALLVAAGFAFAVSLGEFGATVFIARPDTPTLPVAISRFLGQPGALNYGQAMAAEHDPDGAAAPARCWHSSACASTARESSDAAARRR